MIDLKNMITKQQKFIDDNDIVGKHDGSKWNNFLFCDGFHLSDYFNFLDIDFFSDDENEKDMIGDNMGDDGAHTDNQEEES